MVRVTQKSPCARNGCKTNLTSVGANFQFQLIIGYSQDRRHGPYKVISVYKNNKQRQISIKKTKVELWDQAVHYQYQIKSLNESKKIFKEIEKIINTIIQLRLKEFPDE